MANRLSVIGKGLDAKKVKECKMVPCMVGDAFSYATRHDIFVSSRVFEQSHHATSRNAIDLDHGFTRRRAHTMSISAGTCLL